jgi:predicted transcriptional regulator
LQSYKSWTDKEIQFLKKFYPTKGSKYVAMELGRTQHSVIRQASRLGIKLIITLSHRAFTPQEIIFIKKNYALKGCHYISKMLGRSISSIYKKARKFGLERNINLKWSNEEDEYLRKWYKRPGNSKGKKRASEIARHLKRSTQAVVVRARKLGLFQFYLRRWTNDEEHFLIKNFRKMTYKQIGKHLNRTRSSVEGKIHSMKMIKVVERRWTPKEKRLLTRFYGKIPIAEMAKRLNRTPGSIVARAAFQKLKKERALAYTENEINFIRKNYLKMTNDQIAKKLNSKRARIKRTSKGIIRMGRILGLVGSKVKLQVLKKSRIDFYTKEEIEFIRKNYLKMTNEQIAQKLNSKRSSMKRTSKGIIRMGRMLGLTGKPAKQRVFMIVRKDLYTDDDKEFIRKNYLKMTNIEIAKKLNRTDYGIREIAKRMGLRGSSRKRQLWIRGNPDTFYTEAEKNFIRKNYLKMTNEQLAKKLNRTVNSIGNTISRSGLAGHPERKEHSKTMIRNQSR